MNTDTRQLILETTNRLCTSHVDHKVIDAVAEGHWPEALWAQFTEAGLTRAADQAADRQMSWADVYAPLRILGQHAAPVPLAEVLIVSQILHEANHEAARSEAPIGLVCAYAHTQPRLQKNTLTGRLPHVSFGRHLQRFLVAFQQEGTWRHVLLDAENLADLEQDGSMAGEPRDHLLCQDAPVQPVLVPAPEKTCLLFALSRVLLMTGAMEAALMMAVDYALTRRQFGRPIASFQAVQQQLAMVAGEVAASVRATEAALSAVDTQLLSTEVAVAKARVGEAAGLVNEITHQVHGAIGFTYEHHLHYRTRRLLTWRDEAGNEAYWQLRLGRHIVAAGADRCWPFMVQPEPIRI